MQPLGDMEADEIEPGVAAALTPHQIEWLHRKCSELHLKKLQILRQALFEWLDEHPDYRFSASTFGPTMWAAMEKFINRHRENSSLSDLT